ncbi:hypothetical protein O1R50_24585 [Glycomyces luteolus]|uniref:Uncharacterized protein n=1 Tax=Glycomyces luteolus TaxID=2670330 RepID=A0A9X3SSD6_9ACTN|nr:hypothetical protein [Glycomyces luteolus]MDA1362817.1 hypothetical protein [Glycomyces luteolus]
MRLIIRGLAVAATGLAFLGLAVPAGAHPLGDPQTVHLAASGNEVTARWSAPPDDLLVLGSVTGVLADRREYVFDLGAGGEPEPVGDSDADKLTAAREVAEYLSEHITVAQDGRECPAEVDLEGLTEDGAVLVFTCDREIATVDVAVTMLTDADPAYRTVAFADGGTVGGKSEQQLYSAEAPTATWHFDARAAGGADWPMVAAIGGVLVLVVAMSVVGLRRLRSAARR